MEEEPTAHIECLLIYLELEERHDPIVTDGWDFYCQHIRMWGPKPCYSVQREREAEAAAHSSSL